MGKARIATHTCLLQRVMGQFCFLLRREFTLIHGKGIPLLIILLDILQGSNRIDLMDVV